MKQIMFKIITALLVIATLLPLAACAPQAKSYTIGVVSPAASMEPVLQGFKEGMAEKGFVEGENVTYIYNGPLGADAATLEAEVQSFVDAKVDLILALATPGTVAAQKVTAGTGVPVVFTPISDPLGAGFVDARGLLLDTAAKLGVEVITPEVANADEIPAVIAAMPEDIDAIFCMSDSMILSKVADFVAAGNERKIPVTAVSRPHVEAGTLMGFGSEFITVGKQTAGLAAQILNGADPATLPVEESEYFLFLNQKTADLLGITLTDEALKAAAGIIR